MVDASTIRAFEGSWAFSTAESGVVRGLHWMIGISAWKIAGFSCRSSVIGVSNLIVEGGRSSMISTGTGNWVRYEDGNVNLDGAEFNLAS
jgi:hypothetical protein